MRRALLGGFAAILLTFSVAFGTQAYQGFEGGYSFDAVNIRTDPYLSATVIGLGYTSHSTCMHYYDTGDYVNGSPWWWHHTNVTTSKTGWSHEDYLFIWQPTTDCYE